MTVITITLPREEDAAALLKLARELGATEVTVQEEPTPTAETAPLSKVSDRFRWRQSRARTTDLGGKTASQLCIEDREDDWR